MKFIYRIFPLLFLLTGCYDLFGPKTETMAEFILEISPRSSSEKIKEILHQRLLNNGFYSENIKMEISGNKLELSLDNYDIEETPLKELRQLLTGAGNLEFWETYENTEVIGRFSDADKRLAEILASENAVDSSLILIDTSSVTQLLLTSSEKSDQSVEKYRREHPLFIILAPHIDQQGKMFPGPAIGRSWIKDTAQVMNYLSREEIKKILPYNFAFRWSESEGVDSVMTLIGLKSGKEGRAALHGEIIADAHKEYGDHSALPYISITMTDEAAIIWEQLTRNNIGRSIAIVVDGQVFSYPTVQSQITGGVSQITGNFTADEADAIVAMLKAGMLAGSVKIISEIIVKKR